MAEDSSTRPEPGTASSNGSSSTSTEGSDSSSGTSSGVDGSTTSAPGICGDGSTDPGEDCDDANEVDGDGCNTDCRASGSVIWAETLPTVSGTGSDTLNALVFLDDGQVLAGGSRFVSATQSEANLVRFSAEGQLEIEVDLVTSERVDSVRGLAVDGAGRIYVVGERDNVPNTQSSGWIAQVDADGALIGAVVDSSVGARSGFRALATGPGLISVVGFRGDGTGVSTHVRSYAPDLSPGGTDDSVGSDPVETQSYLRDVAMDEHGIYVAGYRMDGTTLRGFTTTSPVTNVAYVPANLENHTYVVGVAIAQPGQLSSTLWSVGWNNGTDVPLIAQLYQVSRTGDIAYTSPSYFGETSEGAFYSSIVIDPAGNLLVAGGSFVGEEQTDFVPLVRKLDPEGAEIWTRVIDVPDSVRGGISELALDEDGTIAVCGHASDVADERRQLVAKLRP